MSFSPQTTSAGTRRARRSPRMDSVWWGSRLRAAWMSRAPPSSPSYGASISRTRSSGRRARAAVADQVGRERAESGLAHGGEDVAPEEPGGRKTVQEQHRVAAAHVVQLEGDLADGDGRHAGPPWWTDWLPRRTIARPG